MNDIIFLSTNFILFYLFYLKKKTSFVHCWWVYFFCTLKAKHIKQEEKKKKLKINKQ